MINWLPVKTQGGYCSECENQIPDMGESYIYGSVEKNTVICPSCLKKKNPVEVTINNTIYQQTI